MSDDPNTNYLKQDRGNLSDYEEYFAGMDASMQQKIALTTAHFPVEGKIADMGSGSGSGTFDLARLYKNLELVGVDINPVTVEYSNDHYASENLSFTVGDIAENVFPENSLDGILDSSVLHHVTSFNDFDVRQIAKTLHNQITQLKQGGVLIIRDFVIPDNAERRVFLDLPTGDGKISGEIAELSTAALFEVFARDFRSSLNTNSAVEFMRLESTRANFMRFEATLKTCAEFVLRKDYRDHWSPELLEEYAYYSQDNFEENFRKENLRIVVSMPLWNPWIVENRFVDKFYLSDLSENNLTFPPTNYLIVGEKVSENDGVQLAEKTAKNIAERPFLHLNAYIHLETHHIYELVERPQQTVDFLPWFEDENGQVFILAKKDFPRPIVNARSDRKNLNRARYSGYLTEPISALLGFRSSFSDFQYLKTKDKNPLLDILEERSNLLGHQILNMIDTPPYYTSPGGIDERVVPVLVKIAPFEREPQEIENYTKFNSAGTVRQLDALQVLRASHVGGMFDARLEINIYRLLRTLNRSASAWIGASVSPNVQSFSGAIETSFGFEKREMFQKIKLEENNFLRLCKSEFVETDSTNNEIARAEFEYVVPKNYSKNTVAAIPFIKTEDSILVGIEFRDLPAPQRFSGNSNLACVPAWRLPFEIEHKFDLENFLREKFSKDFNVHFVKFWELGGSYFTSAGITPEIVYPAAIELNAENLAKTDLKFFHLKGLLESSEKIQDAHFLILLNRLGHALGFLSK